MKSILNYIKLLLVIAVIVSVSSCAVNPVTGKKQIMLMSEKQEIEMGKQYDPQVIATFGQYEDEELLAFLVANAAEMGKISHRPNLEYHIRILDSPVINAFAVPGGYIYFTRGILAQFNNEAEVIGVLGHEMGHITARHSVSQQSKQQLGQLLLLGGMIASEDFRDFAGYAMQGMQLLFLKFSRDNETESDRLGVEYSSHLQYDAREMANFFNVLDKMSLESSSGGVPNFLSTHPDPGDRLQNVRTLAGHWQDSLNYSNWKVNEKSYLQMIDGMVYGEDPRQGYVEDNVFLHPQLEFRFPVPAGWKLVNSPLQVQIAPDNGRALMIFMLAQQTSAGAAAESTLKELKLDLLDSKQTTVNGLPAVATLSEQKSQNPQTGQTQILRILSYFIEYQDKVYVFHGLSTETDFGSYLKLFESTMMGFNRVTNPSVLNKEPRRIRVVQVQRNGTLSDVLRNFNVPQDQMNELALLNNLELTDQVQAGELIKIIQE